MQSLAQEAKDKNVLFLCEMGLDPGIDHMSAMELIHRIQNKGGVITGFKSHCGGLIAPESDNNPWHYKISWNPRNIILAGKAGAIYLTNGKTKQIAYEQLFSNAPSIQIPTIGTLAYYPNRNSLSYIETYSLNGVENFMRTTLRHPAFCSGWDAIIQLDLTSENPINLKSNETIKGWFLQHLQNQKLTNLFNHLMQNEALKEQFNSIGIEEDTIIPANINPTNAGILQWLLENKWELLLTDKDMVVMMHEIEYSLANERHNIQTSLILKGKDSIHTAMAATVGLPLAMSVCAYLNGEITLTGVQIPTHPSIYTPILKSLAEEGIKFQENSY
jgi:saccharopine dehydrogenase (NADP+, L-glutamate forming)